MRTLPCFRSTIREKIIPHAVSWFTGEALEGDGYEDNDEEGDDNVGDDDDEEDEDEGEDDDEEDDDEEVRGSKVILLFTTISLH